MVPLCQSDVLDANHASLSLFFTSAGRAGSHTLAGFKLEDEHLGVNKDRPRGTWLWLVSTSRSLTPMSVCQQKGPGPTSHCLPDNRLPVTDCRKALSHPHWVLQLGNTLECKSSGSKQKGQFEIIIAALRNYRTQKIG